jgi:hypothetical protein
MNVQASIRTTSGAAAFAREHTERGHRTRLLLAWLLAAAVVLIVAGYGYDYYGLEAAQRPFSPKHELLRPSGTIGMKLGMLGVLLFFLIYLYPLRKKWGWLARQGNSRHWLDFHVVLGTTAPLIVAFHSSFKFGNIAGMAFWSMLAVTISGFVGRYLYSQIPRSLNAAELSLKELEDMENSMRRDLANQQLTFGSRMEAIFDLPDAKTVASISIFAALLWMIFIDCKRPFQVALLRLHAVGFGRWLISICGLRETNDSKLEHAISVARRQSALSKRVLFLSRTQQVFHLWHVVHRPFSYAFAILAILHIGIALFMGYRL